MQRARPIMPTLLASHETEDFPVRTRQPAWYDGPPGLVSPEAVHASCLNWVHVTWVVAQDIHVDVHDHEVQEDLNATHFAC
jgi:hypothetical protein